MAAIVRRTGRAVWVVQQPAVAEGLARNVRKAWPEAEVGLVTGGVSQPAARDLVIVSAVALQRKPERVREIGRFDLLTLDPASEITEGTMRVVEALGCGVDTDKPYSGPYVFGLADSPRRPVVRHDVPEHDALSRVRYPFESVIYALPTEVAIELADRAGEVLSRASSKAQDAASGAEFRNAVRAALEAGRPSNQARPRGR